MSETNFDAGGAAAGSTGGVSGATTGATLGQSAGSTSAGQSDRYFNRTGVADRDVERTVNAAADRSRARDTERDRVDTDVAADERIRASVARGADSAQSALDELIRINNMHLAEQVAASARQTKELEAHLAEVRAVRLQQLTLMTTRASRQDEVACENHWSNSKS